MSPDLCDTGGVTSPSLYISSTSASCQVPAATGQFAPGLTDTTVIVKVSNNGQDYAGSASFLFGTRLSLALVASFVIVSQSKALLHILLQ